MKKTLLLLSVALSLFAGSAFAAGVIPNGDGISMAQPRAPPVIDIPVLATAPALVPLDERTCLASAPTATVTAASTSLLVAAHQGHFDTDDPRSRS